MNNTNLHFTSGASQQIIDAMITRQYMNILGTSNQTDGIIHQTIYQVLQLMICMSIEDIRSGILNILNNIKSFIYKLYEYCINMILNINFKSIQPFDKNQHKLNMKGYVWELNIENSNILLTHIVNSINNNKLKGTYKKTGIDKWKLENIKEQTETSEISNITFEINDDITCYVEEPIIYSITYLYKNGLNATIQTGANYEPILDTTFEVCKNPPKYTTKSLFSGLTAAHLIPIYYRSNSLIPHLNSKISYEKVNNLSNITYDFQAYSLIATIVPNSGINDITYFCVQLSIINAAIDEFGNYINDPNLIDFTNKKNIINWGCVFCVSGYEQAAVKNGNYGNVVPACAIVDLYKKELIQSLHQQILMNPDLYGAIRLHLHYASRGLYVMPKKTTDRSELQKKLLYDNLDTKDDNHNTMYAKLKFYSTLTPTPAIKDAVVSWKNSFTKTIISTSNIKGNKQKIFYISTNKKVTTTYKSNPAYDEWQEKYKIEDLKKPEFMERIGIIDPPPQKRIESSTITYELIKKEMREMYKPFNTLYLSNENHTRIKRGIEMFRDKKDILQSMGLPNKFGLFLYGPPGTGKTSTIYAVASELARPVYYVHLKNQMTCKEFQMILDHINKETVGGGIIVFEDVDVMSNVVLAGTVGSTSDNVFNIGSSDETPLSLSYFLNVLDGALTSDDSVIICTTNHPELLHEAFMRIGRFDMHIKLDRANHEQIRAVCKQMLSHDIPSHIIASIPEYKWSTSEIIFRIKDYMLDVDATDDIIFTPFMIQTITS